jgi:hypothetical protein
LYINENEEDRMAETLREKCLSTSQQKGTTYSPVYSQFAQLEAAIKKLTMTTSNFILAYLDLKIPGKLPFSNTWQPSSTLLHGGLGEC